MIRISKILFLFFGIAAVVIYFVSCEKYTFLDVPMIPEDTIFYRADIQPIFDTKYITTAAIPKNKNSIFDILIMSVD